MRLIDADALIAEYDRVHVGEPGGARKLMMDAPTVEERKTGKWIDNGLDSIGAMGIEYRWQKCSCCGYEISKAPMQRFPRFCAYCGADMRRREGAEWA